MLTLVSCACLSVGGVDGREQAGTVGSMVAIGGVLGPRGLDLAAGKPLRE